MQPDIDIEIRQLLPLIEERVISCVYSRTVYSGI